MIQKRYFMGGDTTSTHKKKGRQVFTGVVSYTKRERVSGLVDLLHEIESGQKNWIRAAKRESKSLRRLEKLRNKDYLGKMLSRIGQSCVPSWGWRCSVDMDVLNKPCRPYTSHHIFTHINHLSISCITLQNPSHF